MRVILGDGLLGGELIRQTRWTYFSRKKDGIDITMPVTYDFLLDGVSEVINCIGHTDTWSNVRDTAWRVNCLGVMDLVDICNKKNIKLVHISTDYVYTYTPHPSSEEDIPIHFNNWYVYSKVMADAYIQARCKKYLIIRSSFKPRPFPWGEAWTSLRGNFDYVDTIANLMVSIINKGAEGIYNVGTRPKTMYELAIQTKPNCLPIEHEHAPFNITMNLSKLHELLSHNDI